MSRRRAREGHPPASVHDTGRTAEPPRPAPQLSLAHPALIAAALVAAGCVLFSVSFQIVDTDLWQHLAVGRAIWTLHEIPARQIWTWPTFGEPYVLPSWGFRALLWPFWSVGGVPGLFAWRWVTTLAAFALLWAAARRMGARGFTPLVVLVVASLVYRLRSQVRPETLAAVLLALEVWILEVRRAGGRDHTRWLVPITWVWANVHISYPLAFALLAIHHAGDTLGAWNQGRRAGGSAAPAGGAPGRGALLRRDAVTALAMAALALANPFGWRTLAQPFEYFLFWRNEPIFQTVSELQPVRWSLHLTTGLPLIVLGWPLLVLWRARRGAFDAAEALLAAFLITIALRTQRFTGFLALGAAPYLARDLDAWVRARRWPAWSRDAGARALLAAAACVGLGMAAFSQPGLAPGVGLRMERFPVRACDFVAAHGVRGRGFNGYSLGGYMLWRFWPDGTRLPFMDIHQTGTREDRRLATFVAADPAAWRELDRRHRFDYALLNRYLTEGDQSLDALDADSSFALVFMDDNAALYVRRTGPLAPVADSFAYRVVPAGPAGLRALGMALAADSTGRARAAAELERSIRASEFNATAHSVLASLAMMAGRNEVARSELRLALARNPNTRNAWERLAMIAMSEGRPRAALSALAREKPRAERRDVRESLRREARALLGELEARRAELRAALGREPGRRDLADSLAVVERRLAP